MYSAECEDVFYPASTYVWCKGESKVLGRHAIFVSSPVKYVRSPEGRFTVLTCRHSDCSLREQSMRYLEQEIGFEDACVPAK
jgi:hypothetical protein